MYHAESRKCHGRPRKSYFLRDLINVTYGLVQMHMCSCRCHLLFLVRMSSQSWFSCRWICHWTSSTTFFDGHHFLLPRKMSSKMMACHCNRRLHISMSGRGGVRPAGRHASVTLASRSVTLASHLRRALKND